MTMGMVGLLLRFARYNAHSKPSEGKIRMARGSHFLTVNDLLRTTRHIYAYGSALRPRMHHAIGPSGGSPQPGHPLLSSQARAFPHSAVCGYNEQWQAA